MRLTPEELSALYERNPDLKPSGDAVIFSRALDLPVVKAAGISRDEMNHLESDYAAHLELQKKADLLKAWWFHPFNLRLAKKHFLEIDFGILQNDGEYQIHETKGYMREDALNRLKVASVLHPFRVFVVERSDATFRLTAIEDWSIRNRQTLKESVRRVS